MKKKNLWIMAITMLTVATTIPAYAGTWKQETIGWWYQNDDSSYSKNSWQWIDGNNDGIAECYYFDGNGYLLSNTTTPDGCQVDTNGAWIVNNVVQTKNVGAASGGTGTTTGGGGGSGSVGGGNSTGTSGGNSQVAQGMTNENGYVVKRIGAPESRKVDGGTRYWYYDYTGWDNFDTVNIRKYKMDKNYAYDGDIFCPDSINFPNCVLKEVVLDGNEVVKVTPIWINNGEWDYGGFSNAETEVVGRLEWREYEYSDPVYAEQMKQELTEEAKQRAFEIYPNMIVDYSN